VSGKEIVIEIQESGVIAFSAEACVGCGTCELMCTLFHESVGGRELSRIRIIRDPFNHEYQALVCPQCLAPSCYAACLASGNAIRIDEDTGARYVDEEACILCEECIKACPFEEPRIRSVAGRDVVIKCDLCREREAGPICVEYCPVEALAYVPRDQR
jgi:carbon-monoxide dehydrogenase iron sulfur subunit